MKNNHSFLVTTDDICPSFIEKYWQYWDELKKEFPKLHILAFTVPFYNQQAQEDTLRSKVFAQWYSARKEWVTIGLHGLDHSYPPEYTRPFAEKRKLIAVGYNRILSFLPAKGWAAKAPGNKIDGEAVKILAFFGCRWVFLDDNIVHDTKLNLTHKLCRVFSTHTNGKTYDSIETIYYFLRKAFCGINFTNPGAINENFLSRDF